ncbi:MAG: DUF3021 domain-containing protein [Lachnospiraceae bacterium]|nr:DUF3021 domain-containing protein [Lachnospiraceae bacterium]
MKKNFRKFLLAEVGIEFKACLYFFAFLFFYCMYRIIAHGSFQADMIVMAEMILTTYIMGYVQVYLLKNFEESEHLGAFELLASLGCSLFYAGLSHLLSWFDRAWLPELLFFAYVLLCYVSIFCIYYVRRHWDTEELNLELEAFKNNRKPKE